MNRRELLKAIPAIPGVYVNGRLDSKVADEPPAKRAFRAKIISQQLVMHRTRLSELLTALKSVKTLIEHDAAEKAAEDFIYRVVQPILAPELVRCLNCHKLVGDHKRHEFLACWKAIDELQWPPAQSWEKKANRKMGGD